MSVVTQLPGPPSPSAAGLREVGGVAAGRAPRLSALDAWRGLTVLLMLLVNNVALDVVTPRQLQHAPWGGGLTFTDLVFPWFLFCAGVALPFSLAAARRAGVRGWKLAGKQAQRALLLYLVGALLTSAEEHQLTLGLGVLQLIALAGLFAGLLSSLGPGWRLLVAWALLLGYDLFLHHDLVGGMAGVFTEAQNPARALNGLLTPWGLRGLISVVPTTALVLLGSVVAQPLQGRHPRARPLLLGAGLLLSAVGWLWAGHLEFNKAVWTPGYVVYTSGLATLGVALFSLIGDGGSRRGAALLTPLTIPGRNALFAYVAPILFKVLILTDWQVSWTGRSQTIQAALLSLLRGHLGLWYGGWVYTLGYVLLVWLALALLARRGLIWKL